MNRPPILVIGAGMGGLSAAALLAADGEDVLLLERAATPGGKLRQVMIGGLPVDAGPTVFTMRWVFDALFADAGGDFASALRLMPSDLLARHAWDDRGYFDLFADQGACDASIGDFFGATEVAGYRAFCREAASIYDVLREPFLLGSRPNPVSLMTRIGLARLPQAMAIRPHQSLWSAVSRHFRDPRLRQLFGRYATYCGASPFAAPATLMLIAHVERQGVWLATDGMHAVARAIEALGMRAGARYRYDADVAEIMISGGRACGVRLRGGEDIAASAVIWNGDPAALAKGLLGAAASRAVAVEPAARRSLSSMTWLLRARTGGFPLVRHNVFFSGDYKAEFDAIFGAGALPDEPTIYICAQDRDDQGRRSGDGPERLQLIVNAPANGDVQHHPAAGRAAYQARVFAFLARLGLRVELDEDSTRLVTPADYEALFPASGGSLYGLANHGWRAPFQRPGAASRIPGLYLAGGGVHPGAGMPMAVLSGRLAAARVLADLSSGRQSVRG